MVRVWGVGFRVSATANSKMAPPRTRVGGWRHMPRQATFLVLSQNAVKLEVLSAHPKP